MINYVKGDATMPELLRPDGTKIITHICNDVCAWGAGFVMAVSRRFPQAKSRYMYAARHGMGLGAVVFVDPQHCGIMVANMIAQHGIGRGKRRVRYGPLRTCLKRVATFAQAYLPDVSIHMPRIGCGLGGGTWEVIGQIVEEELADLDVLVYGK